MGEQRCSRCVMQLWEDDATKWGQILQPQGYSLDSKWALSVLTQSKSSAKLLTVYSFSSGIFLYLQIQGLRYVQNVFAPWKEMAMCLVTVSLLIQCYTHSKNHNVQIVAMDISEKLILATLLCQNRSKWLIKSALAINEIRKPGHCMDKENSGYLACSGTFSCLLWEQVQKKTFLPFI